MSVFKKIDISSFFDEINEPLLVFSKDEIIYFNKYFKKAVSEHFEVWEEYFDLPEIQESIRLFFDTGKVPEIEFVKTLKHSDGTDVRFQWVFVNLPSTHQGRICIAKGRKFPHLYDVVSKRDSYVNNIISPSKTLDFIQRILRYSHDMLVILDGEGVFKYASASIIDKIGFDPEHMIGRSFQGFIDKGIVQIENGNIQEVLDSKTEVGLDFWICHPDGRKYFIESFGRNLIDDPLIEGVLLSAREITAFKKTEKSLLKRYELENLINRISAKFVNAGPEDIDMVFNRSLQMLGEFEKADRAYIFLVHKDLNEIENIFEWTGPGIESQIQYLKHIPITEENLTIKVLEKGEILIISDVDLMEDRFEYERKIYQEQGIKSVVLIPVFSENRLIGFFGLDAVGTKRDWHEKDEYVLRQLGDIYAGTFINRSIRKKLERNESLLASTELLAKSGSWRYSNSKKRLFFSKGLNRVFDLDQDDISASITQFLHKVQKKDRIGFIQNLNHAISQLSATTGEFVIIDKSRREKFISYSIQVRKIKGSEDVEVYGYCTDITHKRDAENYLRLQSQILAQVNDPIFVTDPDLKVIYMNKAAYRECHITPNNGYHGTITDLFGFIMPDNKSLDQVLLSLDKGKTFRQKLRLKSQKNNVEPYEVSIQAFLNDESEKIGYSFLLRNLTLFEKQESLANKARLIVENSPAVLFIIDPVDNFRIVYITKNINQFGYDAEELIKNADSVLDLIHPDDAVRILNYHQSRKSEKGIPAFSGEYRIRKADGTYRWVEDKTREVYDQEGKILLHEGLLQDITERRKDREEIEKNQQRYRVLAANIPLTNVFLIDKDLKYIVAEGTNFVNWGMTSADFEGKTLEEVHKYNLHEIQPVVIRALIKREIVQKILVYNRRVYEMTVRPIIHEEEVEYALGIVRDINEEYQAKENLRKNEEKYRSLVEESTEIIFTLSLDLTLTYISPNVKQFLGYDADIVTGKNLMEFLHPDDLDLFGEQTKSGSEFFESNQFLEFRLKHRTGDFRVFSSNGKLIRDEEGNVRYYTGIARDITSLKEAQRDLFHAKERAENASKIKSQFLSTMSHEIRTPMNAVIGMAHLLIDDNPRPDQLENLKTLQFSAENLLGLINDILDYSKIDSGKIELEKVGFDLKNVFNRIIHSYTYQTREKDLEIKFLCDPSIPKELLGDPVRLGQIINNLVSNAIKFTEKGFIRISLHTVTESRKHIRIKFEFEDTGIGIPQEKLDTVFEAFTQASTETTRKYGGTGLGLAIVKRLVELFGSQIQTTMRPEGGTKFAFEIDFEKPETIQKVIQQKAQNGEKYLKNATILIAEDNIVNQIMIKKFLIKWGVKEIVIADDGLEAIEALERQPFNLILLDLQMPGKDGYEVAEYLREHKDTEKRNTPIIALTASSLLEVKDQLEKSGMNDYIPKPFNPDNLYAKILKYLKV